jgi:hypothetical protein
MSDKKAIDPLLVSALISQGIRLWADYAEMNAKGEITDADIAKMLSHLKTDIASFHTLIQP